MGRQERMKAIRRPTSNATLIVSEITAAAFSPPQGQVRLSNSTLIYDTGKPDPVAPQAREIPVQHLPNQVLQYLLSSRDCEVDRMSNTGAQLLRRHRTGMEPSADRVHMGSRKSHLRISVRECASRA